MPDEHTDNNPIDTDVSTEETTPSGDEGAESPITPATDEVVSESTETPAPAAEEVAVEEPQTPSNARFQVTTSLNQSTGASVTDRALVM